MLTANEKSVLSAVLKKCGERSSCLFSVKEYLASLPAKRGITEGRLREILDCLAFDGYIDVVLTDRHGETVYCITLLKRGKGYKRESVQSKREIIYRAIIAIASAVITFAVGRLLYFIIN